MISIKLLDSFLIAMIKLISQLIPVSFINTDEIIFLFLFIKTKIRLKKKKKKKKKENKK